MKLDTKTKSIITAEQSATPDLGTENDSCQSLYSKSYVAETNK